MQVHVRTVHVCMINRMYVCHVRVHVHVHVMYVCMYVMYVNVHVLVPVHTCT